MDFREIDNLLIAAHDAGVKAYHSEISKYENPHDVGTLSFDAWNGGWKTAQEEYDKYSDGHYPKNQK